jgi:diaminopimelate epimerase
MRFVKMHGLGNDYVYVSGFDQTIDDPESIARAVSDRHFGIGSDGLILVLPSTLADVRMRMFNIDGSEGQMCGNGVRCVAKFAWDRGLARTNPMRVETGRGVLSLKLALDDAGKVASVTVDMDEPILDITKIPFDPAVARPGGSMWKISLDGRDTWISPVSMGNPHGVIFVSDVDAIDLSRVGPMFERHACFPQRANVHWAQVVGPAEMKMRTWERGSGITLACGTGACAVLVAAVRAGLCERDARIHLPGGTLQIRWDEATNHVFMTGPATEVFEGTWTPPHTGG